MDKSEKELKFIKLVFWSGHGENLLSSSRFGDESYYPVASCIAFFLVVQEVHGGCLSAEILRGLYSGDNSHLLNILKTDVANSTVKMSVNFSA